MSRVFEEKQRFNQWWLQLMNIGLLAFLGYCAYSWFIKESSTGNVAADDIIGQLVVIIAILLSVGVMYIFRLETNIDEQGIRYRFLPFHRTFRNLRWNELQNCYTRKYRPLSEYGGWGYRFGRGNGKALNVKGTYGIQTVLKDGTKILIGTQRPEEAQQVINTYFQNERV